MSLQRALETIALNKTDRIPRWIGVPRHAEFLERLTGLDPTANPREVSLKAIELLDLDVAQYYNYLEYPVIPEGETGDVRGTKVSRFDGLGTTPGGGLTRWEQPARRLEIGDVTEEWYCLTSHVNYGAGYGLGVSAMRPRLPVIGHHPCAIPSHS